jgi:hypothetical protein
MPSFVAGFGNRGVGSTGGERAIDRRRPRRGRAAAQARAHAAWHDVDGVGWRDGDLQEHAVPARDGTAEAEPGAAAADRAGPSGAARRARGSPADRRSAHSSQAGEAPRARRRAADPTAEGAARVEGRDPARAQPARAPHARGPRVALHPVRDDAADPRRARHHPRPGRGGGVRHPCAALVRRRRRRAGRAAQRARPGRRASAAPSRASRVRCGEASARPRRARPRPGRTARARAP